MPLPTGGKVNSAERWPFGAGRRPCSNVHYLHPLLFRSFRNMALHAVCAMGMRANDSTAPMNLATCFNTWKGGKENRRDFLRCDKRKAKVSENILAFQNCCRTPCVTSSTWECSPDAVNSTGSTWGKEVSRL